MKQYLNQLGNYFIFLEKMFGMPMWSFTPQLWFGVMIVMLFHNGITVLGGIVVIVNYIIYRMVVNLFIQSYNRQHYINPLLNENSDVFSLPLFFIIGFVMNSVMCIMELGMPLVSSSYTTNWLMVVIRSAEIFATILLFANTQGPVEKRQTHYATQN